MKNAFSRFLLAAVLMAGIILMPAAVPGVRAMQDTADTAAGASQRPSDTGALHVEGTQLCGENGQEVILRGVSTHGLTWYPDYVNEKLFRQVSEEWDCNLVRLAAYSEEYCRNEESREETMRLQRRGIDAAVAADMYVLADWHILNDANPNENAEAAAVFFETVSREYGDLPNILYEICNEPNGKTSWADVRAYAEKIIPVIRANDADAVIIIGTPDFDRDLMASVLDP
ncbi:MAG: glycoside hydrolase family 5 protein, partial [Lachnospiraceae bacterium]|nr:glycoside hydrolase family 5 protein [Lachnospiraceae bacterium]